MAKHKYQRMNPEEFSDALTMIGISIGQFCRITGADRRRVERWLSEEFEIPYHITLICELLKLPGNIEEARDLANEMIIEEAA